MRLLSNRLNSGKRNFHRKAAFERLEVRELMAANLMASLVNGQLYIEGTNNADAITVRQVGSQISVDKINILAGGKYQSSVAASQVSSVLVKGLGGNDTVRLDATTLTKNATVYGGAGDDYLVGGAVADYIYGEDGNDKIWGMNGDDLVNGGNGNDQLVAGNGNDSAWGGTGNDNIWSEAGDDLLVGEDGNDYLNGGAGRDAFYGCSGTNTCWDDFNLSQPVINGATISDVIQGTSGTCSFNSTMAGAARVGINFNNIVQYAGNNRYTVHLYVNGQVSNQTVYFDGTWIDTDSMPTYDANHRNVGDFWTTVAQRGYLQSFGIDWTKPWETWSQKTTAWRDPVTAISRLTNWRMSYTAIASVNMNNLANILNKSGIIVTHTLKTVPANTGLANDHAYTLIGVDTARGTVTLRNPWAVDGPNGAITGANDGLFTISWQTYIKNFAGCSIGQYYA